jgi:phage terminase large subunit-like protein
MMPTPPATIPLSVAQLRAAISELKREVSKRRLLDYRPYPKQRLFHEAGATYRERLLMAANQVGKTMSAAAEVAMHLTGLYPSWWRGKVFNEPPVGWAAGVTGEATRDNAQRMLMGRITEIGTGMIPRDRLIDYTYRRGVADAIDTAVIRFGGGGDVQAGQSIIQFKSYDQGRAKFQGETLDFGWCDEEPPDDVYSEFLTRLNVKHGPMLLTFTPLLGMSAVVRRFLIDKPPGSIVISMTIEDAEHYSAEERDRIEAGFPEHEREARARGIPIMGSGRVFPIEESRIRVEAFPLPQHWPRICGLDFGWDHPTAAVWMAWDRDTDTVYVYDVYRVKAQPVPVHASAIRARGPWMPIAWPHDGLNETAAGPALARQYREEGLNMLPEHAKLEKLNDKTGNSDRRVSTSVEAGIQEMLTAMMDGRFKVFAHLNDWWEEFRLYYREDGRIVKKGDDLMSATRYGFVSLRHAALPPRELRKLRSDRPFNWRAG